ncbi:response regulator [bacterium]|nr:response regulator [bacterium]
MSRVLVIDDDAVIRQLLRELLTREGHDVVVCADGRDAADIWRERAFDLIVTDIFMPEMDGLSVVMELARTHPRPRVIAISGGAPSGFASYLPAAERFGADRTFGKPFDPGELLAAVRELLETGDDRPPPEENIVESAPRKRLV